MSHRRTAGKFVCVWLDNQTNQSENYADAQDVLRTMVDSFQTFNNCNQCVDFIINMTSAKILLISINTLAEKIIPVIYFFEQIDSIYLFSPNKSTDKDWTNDYTKIKGFFHDIKFLSDQIKEDIIQSRNDSISISFISSTDVTSHDVNRQDPLFMYSQLLKEIILNDHKEENEEETRQEMLLYCRKIHSKSSDILNILDEFEQNYIPELSIYWYTRECFLYRMLNKALWTPQPDVLYKLRYFLRHLHQQIESQAIKQRKNLLPMTVYRGQSMSTDQIEKLQQNVGGFLAFNNFLSTSVKQEVALHFLWGTEVAVLFQMKVDPSIEKFPFANIEHLSYQQGDDAEEEFLFSMGTVFRIIRIDKQKHFYCVQLTLSADMDEQLAQYTKHTREDICSAHSFLSLLKLMQVLAQYNSVDQFAQMLRDDTSLSVNNVMLGSIHHAFGTICNDRGQSKQALDHFRQSLSHYLTVIPADHSKLSPTYNNIGAVHAAQADYETALTFHQLALDCLSNSDNSNILSLVTYTNNIAGIYFQQEKFTQALEYHKRALELQKQYLGENNPSLMNTYNIISVIYYKLHDPEQATSYHEKAVALQENTSQSDPTASAHCSITGGTVCFSQGQYGEALVYFNRALKIQQQYLLPNNPSFTLTYNCFANVYYKQERYDEALRYHKKVLEIELNCLSNDHPSIASSYLNISKDYAGLSYWSEALNNGLKAIEQMQILPQADPSDLTSVIKHVAHIYNQQKNYQEALNYYQRAVEIQQQYFSSSHASLALIYDRIANIYNKQDKLEDALIYYKKALEIERRSLSDDHPSIAVSYINISQAYAQLLCWSDALGYSLEAVKQMKKSSQTDVTALAALMQYVGHIYYQEKEYQQVIIYNQEALKLYCTYLPEDDASLLKIYNRTATAYYKLKQFHEAILFYEKTLKIELKTLPDNAKTIADTYSNLSTAYLGLKQFDQALTTADQALNQLLKTLPYNHTEVVRQRAYLDAIKINQILEEKHY